MESAGHISCKKEVREGICPFVCPNLLLSIYVNGYLCIDMFIIRHLMITAMRVKVPSIPVIDPDAYTPLLSQVKTPETVP